MVEQYFKQATATSFRVFSFNYSRIAQSFEPTKHEPLETYLMTKIFSGAILKDAAGNQGKTV
jgi:hypothetical protein